MNFNLLFQNVMCFVAAATEKKEMRFALHIWRVWPYMVEKLDGEPKDKGRR